MDYMFKKLVSLKAFSIKRNVMEHNLQNLNTD